MEGIIIPVFGIFMIIAVVIGPIWIRSYYKSRERAQLHETLRVAYEKGQPPPPELIEKLSGEGDFMRGPQSGSDSDLRRAIVLISVGIGLVGLGLGLGYGIYQADEVGGWITGGSIAGSGAIPGMIGLAYLFLWLGRRNNSPRV
ncbi:MAG TPA: DUF6249 domain-containing protein [Caulobacteraceae bacterium]|jgi:hypothetical protein